MDVKFVTGSINLGSKKTMNDIVNDVLGAKKVASSVSQNVVKTAEKAEDECKECGKAPCECDEENDCTAEVDTKVKEAKAEEVEEVVAEEDAAAGDEEEKEAKVVVEKKVVAVAQKPKFTKVAKLNQENKTFLREFWLTVYPPEYVEAMLADK